MSVSEQTCMDAHPYPALRLRRGGIDFTDLSNLARTALPGGPRPPRPGEWARCEPAIVDGQVDYWDSLARESGK
jgi:hypothetical protein